jgi:hypothetical protein
VAPRAPRAAVAGDDARVAAARRDVVAWRGLCLHAAHAGVPGAFRASRMRLGPEVTICWFVYCARRSAMEPTLATFGILQQRASSRLMRHLSYDAAVELV